MRHAHGSPVATELVRDRRSFHQDHPPPFTVNPGGYAPEGFDFYGQKKPNRDSPQHQRPFNSTGSNDASMALKQCPICQKRFPDHETLQGHTNNCGVDK